MTRMFLRLNKIFYRLKTSPTGHLKLTPTQKQSLLSLSHTHPYAQSSTLSHTHMGDVFK